MARAVNCRIISGSARLPAGSSVPLPDDGCRLLEVWAAVHVDQDTMAMHMNQDGHAHSRARGPGYNGHRHVDHDGSSLGREGLRVYALRFLAGYMVF